MAEFRVVKAKVQKFPHPNAERLELLKIGAFQAVVQKDIYSDGETIVFAPEKAVLPEHLTAEFKNYLRGSDRNRVGKIRLRGELSMGVILPLQQVDPDDVLPYDEDIAESLGIVKYEPPIPGSLAGNVRRIGDWDFTTHDVEQFWIYAEEFTPNEPVYVWEKIHGSQAMYMRTPTGEEVASSKGILKQGLTIEEAAGNTYWQAARNMKIFELIGKLYPDSLVQVFGEVVPVQRGFSYGYDRPHTLLFKVVVDGEIVPYDRVPSELQKHWVPLLYVGEFELDRIVPLCEKIKRETVSGREIHISEGGVVTPFQPRFSKDGFDLQLKIISKAYAKVEDEDAIS
jgi:RNA ligase (TIGR02306 family)